MTSYYKKTGLVIFFLCCWAAGVLMADYGSYKDRFDENLTRGDALIGGDEKELVWYNWDEGFEPGLNGRGDDANDANTVSIRASESLGATYYMRWPVGWGEPNSVLMTPGVQNAQLVWAQIDANELYIYVEPNDANIVQIGLPDKTPWNVIFVDANGYPLTDDPNHFTYYQPEGAFGLGVDLIPGQTYANNRIQVYTLLDFEPNLLNVTIGRGSDDTATGPNNVTTGNSAGAGLTVGERNTLGGNFAGEAVATRDDDSFYGFEAGKNVGGGVVSSLSDYKYTLISENGSIWGVPFTDAAVITLDADDVVDIGGGIVGINYDNASESGNMRFVENDVINIKGTTNYEGNHTLTAGTTITQLQFADTYTAETLDGTETACRFIGSLSAGLGRMVMDSSGNIYFGHNWDAVNSTYVTRLNTDGTFTYDFLNHAWGSSSNSVEGLAISSDDAYLYVLLAGNVEKYNLSTGDLEWTKNPTGDQGYDIAIDADGNVYIPGLGPSDKMAKLAAADGAETLFEGMGDGGGAGNGCRYHVVVDDDMGVVISGGNQSKLQIGSPSGLYNLAVSTLDNTAADNVQLGGYYESGGSWLTYIVGTGFIATHDGYIYVLCHVPAATLYKYSWDGSSLSEVKSVAGPTYAAGIFFDLWGNLVCVNADWGTTPTDRYYYYDNDLNLLGSSDPFSTAQLKTWDSAVGGVYIQGNDVWYPGVTITADSGDHNTAVGSQALRGDDAGAEPNDATVGGYKAAYTVTTANKPTSWGAYSLGQIKDGDNDTGIGPYAGWSIVSEDDYIVFDSRKRDTIDLMERQSIIVGHMADDPNDQWLNFNADVNFPQSVDMNEMEVDLLTITTATASRLLATDSNKLVVSTDASSWISGTANRVTVTDDGDGTVTLTTPQDTHAGASPTFAGMTLTGDTLNIATPGSISTPTDAGTRGDIRWTSTYLYVCVDTNTWKRTALSTWTASYLLLENGDYLLLENGDKFVLEE